jgi:hypothetical protein
MSRPPKNKNLHRLLHIPALLLLVTFAYGQISVYHVDNTEDLKDKSGVFYALPRTVIKVVVTVERREHYKGPYSDYALKLLGLDDVITMDNIDYTITGFEIATFNDPDPEQYYFIETGEKLSKEQKDLLLNLSESGMIETSTVTADRAAVREVLSGNLQNHDIGNRLYRYFAAPNQTDAVDTIIKRVLVDTIMVTKRSLTRRPTLKSSEQKAVEAAEKLQAVRKTRLDLVSGFQETAYDRGALEYMDQQVKEIEDEYYSLFAGATVTKILRYTFLMIPSSTAGETTLPVCKFSEKQGVLDAAVVGGDLIQLKIQRLQNTSQISALVDARNADKGSRGLYYRMPETAALSIRYGTIEVKDVFLVNQFGKTTWLPAGMPLLQFHPTGAIKGVILE